MVRHNDFLKTRGAVTGAATLLAIAGIAFCADRIGVRLADGERADRPSTATEQNVILAATPPPAVPGTRAPATAAVPPPASEPDGPDAVIEDEPGDPQPAAAGGAQGETAPAPARDERRPSGTAAERVTATGQTRGRYRPALLPLAPLPAPAAPATPAQPLAPAAPATLARQPVRLELRGLRRVPSETEGEPDQVELKVAALGRDTLPTASRNLAVRVAMPKEDAATEAGGSSLHLQLGLVEAAGPLQLRVRIALSQAAVAKPVLSRAAPAELASDALHLWMPLASEPTPPPDPTDPEPAPGEPAPAPADEVPAETPPPGADTVDAPPPPDATVPVDVVATLPSDTPEAPVTQTVDLPPADPTAPDDPAPTPAPSVTVEVGTDPAPPPEPPAPPSEGLAAPDPGVAPEG